MKQLSEISVKILNIYTIALNDFDFAYILNCAGWRSPAMETTAAEQCRFIL
jgi:hypothetical protein